MDRNPVSPAPPTAPSPYVGLGLTPADNRPVSRRITRVGSVLILFGLLMVSVAALLVAYEFYQFATQRPFQFNESNLIGGFEGLLGGVGVLFVAVGWVVDQNATRRTVLAHPAASRGGVGAAGLVTALLGVVLIVVIEFYGAYIDFAAYNGITGIVTNWTLVYEEIALGAGIILVAFGWFVYHLDTLRRLESSPG